MERTASTEKPRPTKPPGKNRGDQQKGAPHETTILKTNTPCQCPSAPLRQRGDGGLYHHLNSIVSFLRKERYNIIIPVILSYRADFYISRSSYKKKTVTRLGDSTRHLITVAVCGGNCDFLLG